MRNTVTSVGLIAGLALAGVAQAQVAWGGGMASGSATFFDWANGQNSNTNLFGTPTLIGSSFYFFPSNFVARSDNGVAPAGFTEFATDTLEVDLIAHPGFKIDGISVQEIGDFSVTGIGAFADINGTLQISDGAHGSLAPDVLNFGGQFPAASGFNTAWNGSAARDLTAVEFGVPFEIIHISVTNNLIAFSVPGSSAVIRKTIVGGAMAINVLPEPGAMGLVAMAGLVALRRRRA